MMEVLNMSFVVMWVILKLLQEFLVGIVAQIGSVSCLYVELSSVLRSFVYFTPVNFLTDDMYYI